MGLTSLKIFWLAPKNFFYFCKSDISAVQGHPRYQSKVHIKADGRWCICRLFWRCSL